MGQPTSATTASNRVYYVFGRWVYAGIGILVGAGGLYLLGSYMGRVSRAGFTPESDWLRFLAVFMALLFAATFTAYGLLNRIVVSPERIEYHSLGFFTMISPWSNAERITDLKLDVGAPPQPWLVLKNTGAIIGRKNPVLLFWKPDLRGQAIPLGAIWARHEDLLADVRRYAPHVDKD